MASIVAEFPGDPAVSLTRMTRFLRPGLSPGAESDSELGLRRLLVSGGYRVPRPARTRLQCDVQRLLPVTECHRQPEC
eukprot:2742406-Rhodomonas_salina.2